MPKIENKTCAITVTYGNRWGLVSQIIERLRSLKYISHIVVVNNGSAYNVKKKIDELDDGRIVLIDHAENMGSAGGYHAGIAYAHQNLADDFVWLLDDDNLPDADALDVLLNTWNGLGAKGDTTALFSLRTDRVIDLKFAQGADPYKHYLIPDDFLGFSIAKIGRNKLGKIVKKLKGNKSLSTVKTIAQKVKMPYVPYGGFFLHRQMIDKIGYPDERFYLYVDDEEYTYRVTQSGGTIWLIPASKVSDIDTTDVRVAYKPGRFSSNYLDLWSFRMYYRVRNSVYFHHKTSLKNALVFNINKAIFTAKLKALSILSSKQKEYKKFLVAVEDGLNGNLGKANPEKF